MILFFFIFNIFFCNTYCIYNVYWPVGMGSDNGEKATTAQYNVTLKCDKPGFCAQVYYVATYKGPKWLWDTYEDEDLDFIPLQCTRTTELHHQIKLNLAESRSIASYCDTDIEVDTDCGGHLGFGSHYLPTLYLRDNTSVLSYTKNLTLGSPQEPGTEYFIKSILRSKKFENDELKQRTLDWVSGGTSALNVFNLLTNGTEEATIPTGRPYVRTEQKIVHETTLVTYNTTLTCGTGKRFCAMSYYVEHDILSKNDDAAFVPLQCSDTGSLNHQIVVNFTGGDRDSVFMYFEFVYEPQIEIYHDCGEPDLLRMLEVRLPEVTMFKRYYSFNYTENVFDNGAIIKNFKKKFWKTGYGGATTDAFRAAELKNRTLPFRKNTWKWWKAAK